MLKRTPLAIKLTLALALTVIVAVGAIAVMVNRSFEQRFDDYLSSANQPRVQMLVPYLSEYYAQEGSWLGADTVMLGSGNQPHTESRGRGEPACSGNSVLILVDESGLVVVDDSGLYLGRVLSANLLDRAVAIRLDNVTVGYLMSVGGQLEQGLKDELSNSILVAGLLGILVATALGLLLTRAITRPVLTVRAAARRIAQGDLATRAPVESNDEVGDLARQFNEMATTLERDENLRQQMMANIAHELRTPLSVIRGQVEALQDGVFPLNTEGLDPIHDQILLLGRLIEDLRDLALAEAGQLPIEMAPVDVGSLVDRVVSGFMRQAQALDIALSSQVNAQVGFIDADAQRLEQVLGNLLSNALRYTPRGGTVDVQCWANDDEVMLAVQDNGPGIGEQDLEHIFERFYRAEKSRSRLDGGSGLGLAIVREIVQAHGGRVEVASTLGLGTTFSVHLPRAGGRL